MNTAQGGLLLLASGSSTRFGSDKRLALLPDGRHVLCATLAAVSAAFDDWRIVLRAGRDAQLPRQLAIDPQRVLFSEHAVDGMGAALADAARAMPIDWPHVFVALADMPWLRLETLLDLRERAHALDAAGSDWILRPRHDGRWGHPVGFSKGFHAALAALAGDGGARAVVAAHPDAVHNHDCQHDDVVRDVDTPADLNPA